MRTLKEQIELDAIAQAKLSPEKREAWRRVLAAMFRNPGITFPKQERDDD